MGLEEGLQEASAKEDGYSDLSAEWDVQFPEASGREKQDDNVRGHVESSLHEGDFINIVTFEVGCEFVPNSVARSAVEHGPEKEHCVEY